MVSWFSAESLVSQRFAGMTPKKAGVMAIGEKPCRSTVYDHDTTMTLGASEASCPPLWRQTAEPDGGRGRRREQGRLSAPCMES